MTWLQQEKARLDSLPTYVEFMPGKTHVFKIDFNFPPQEFQDVKYNRKRVKFMLMEEGKLKFWEVTKDTKLYRDLIERATNGQRDFKVKQDDTKRCVVVD